MKQLDYENFIRDAFGQSSGTLVDRWGDPASFANTDSFNNDNLSNVKYAVGYSMGIFRNMIYSQGMGISDQDHDYIDGFADRLMQCQDIDCIHDLIKEFENNVVNTFMPRT